MLAYGMLSYYSLFRDQGALTHNTLVVASFAVINECFIQICSNQAGSDTTLQVFTWFEFIFMVYWYIVCTIFVSRVWFSLWFWFWFWLFDYPCTNEAKSMVAVLFLHILLGYILRWISSMEGWFDNKSWFSIWISF